MNYFSITGSFSFGPDRGKTGDDHEEDDEMREDAGVGAPRNWSVIFCPSKCTRECIQCENA